MPEMPAVELSALPKLAPTEIRLLWVNDWYDGPLEAVVEHGGERRLMVLHGGYEEVDLDGAMQWVLFRLTPEQWLEEERWHALFEEHVGHHWCFHPGARAGAPAAAAETDDGAAAEPPPADMTRFYEPYKARTPRTLTARAATAWVDEMPTG